MAETAPASGGRACRQLMEPLQAFLVRAETYDELKARLAGLAAEFDAVDQRLIEGLALAGFMAQGAGNGGAD